MTIRAWETYVVCRSESDDRQGNYYKGCKNCECYVSKKNQETNIDVWSFFPCFFSIFLCSFFSFVISTIIRTRKWQRAHFNNASNVNKTITMTSWRNRDIITYLIFPKLYNLELSRIYSFHFVFQTCKITFVSLRYFYSHKTRFSLWWCWLIWISRYAFSNVLKKIFVLRTSISYIVCFNVPQKTQKYAVIYCNTWKVLILIMHSE